MNSAALDIGWLAGLEAEGTDRRAVVGAGGGVGEVLPLAGKLCPAAVLEEVRFVLVVVVGRASDSGGAIEGGERSLLPSFEDLRGCPGSLGCFGKEFCRWDVCCDVWASRRVEESPSCRWKSLGCCSGSSLIGRVCGRGCGGCCSIRSWSCCEGSGVMLAAGCWAARAVTDGGDV